VGTGWPIVENFLESAWSGGYANFTLPGTLTQASNLAFGGNPPYQVSDFLAFYPKFGTYSQAISGISVNAGGTGYAPGDTLTPVQADSSGAVITVATVGAGGVVLTLQVSQPGQGYSVASALPTTTNNAGTGCTLNITALAPGNFVVPQVVIQLYINLALACLNAGRWLDMWPVAMNLFVAHFCTLYLLSDGSSGTTPGQIAQQGLARGIAVSKTAGDVSVSYETVANDLDGFASWNRTEYGQQLATFAKIIGMGPSYIW
jgi:hypothetical protein